jgi:hypothetical protein
LGARTVEVGGLVLGALAAGAIGALSTTVGAVAAAAVCWAAYDGFALNRLGELHAAAADLHAAGYVVGAALVCRAPAAALRAVRACARAGTGLSVALPAVLIADLARRSGLRPSTGMHRGAPGRSSSPL